MKNRPFRVLHLIDSWGPGGAETVFVELATSLHRDHWTSLASVPREGWVSRALEARGIKPTLIPSSGRFNAAYLRALVGLMRAESVDLVHTHLFGAALYGGIAGRLAGVPVLSTLHGEPDLPLPGFGADLRYRLLHESVESVVLVSSALRDAFHRCGPFPGDRSRVIHNGIDMKAFGPRPAGPAGLRKELGLPDETPIIGAVGNFRPAKGLDVFTRAAAHIAKARPDVHFVIAGEPDDTIHPEVVGLRQELGLDGQLTILGFRPDVEVVFQALDVFVCSSLQEGFSLTTVQAMAGKVPVVATRSGGPEEIVRHGVSGLLVSPGDPVEIADAVLRILDSTDVREELVSEGYARATQDFSVTRMLERYQDLYRTVLERRSAGLAGTT